MATIGNTFLDLIDVYKRQEGNGQQIATIIELLKQTNPILDDAIAIECNNGSKHRTTVRTGLPPVTWGMLYKGIAQSKSTTAQVEDATGMAEALSTVDKRLLDLSSNESALRLSEAKAFLESMNIEVARTLFYGNSQTDPEQFTGLAPRFSIPASNANPAANSGQIVDAKLATPTAGKLTSLWIVYWGEQQSHLIYPKGTKAGLVREDKGEQRVQDSSGNPYFVKEELFRWHVGLSVRDWRYVVRICNIDTVQSYNTTPATGFMQYLRQAYWKIHSHRISGGQGAIYCNATVCEMIDAECTPTKETSPANSSYVRLTPDNVTGKEIMSYRGIPIRQCDAISNTEAQLI